MKMNLEEELKSYSIKEVSNLLGFSEKVIRNRRSAGVEPWASLPTVRIGGRVRVPSHRLREWAAKLGLLATRAEAQETTSFEPAMPRRRGRPRKNQ